MQFSDLCMTVIILRISSLYSLIFHPLLVTNANSHETIKQKKNYIELLRLAYAMHGIQLVLLRIVQP